MKNLLVPCDFSRPAVAAFQAALDIGVQSGGEVHLLHVIQLPIILDSKIIPIRAFEEGLFKELREKAERRFSTLIKKHNKNNVTVVTKISFNVPFERMLEYIPENSIDQVIMGSHGTIGFKEFFLGTDAERIVRNSPVPVLIVKEYKTGPVKNIVFPNTLKTEDQESLVQRIKALQKFYNARLHIVRINTPLNFSDDNLTQERLTSFAKRYDLHNFTLNTFSHTDLEDGIHKFSKSVNADMIALGAQGRKGLSRLATRGIAEALINHTKGLVFLV